MYRFSLPPVILLLGAACASAPADPYAFLHDFESPEALNWARETDARSRARLAQMPVRETIRSTLERLAAAPQDSVPLRAGDALLFLRATPGAGSPVLMIERQGTERVLLDPNVRWPGMRIADFRPSPSGRYLLYATTDSTSESLTIRSLNLESGNDIGETTGRRLSSQPWARNESGFYFTRRGGDGRSSGVWFRRLAGEEQRIGIPDWRDDAVYRAFALGDGSLLVLERAGGRVRRHLRRSPGGEWTTLSASDSWQFIGDREGLAYFLDGDRMIVDAANTSIVTSTDPISEAYLFGDRIVALTMRDARPQLVLFDLDGRKVTDLETPPGLIWTDYLLDWPGITGDDRHAYFRTLALSHGGAILRIDLATGATSTFRPPTAGGGDFTTTLVHYPSGDARVPMFVTRRSNAAGGPLLIVSYGSFGFVDLPFFNAKYRMFLDAGGTIAHPNIRGGGIYGQAWHQAGRGANKSAAVADLVNAARWLLQNGFTSAGQVALEANSIGTVAAGAAAFEGGRDLFEAVVLEVPVADLERYDELPGGDQWATELGTDQGSLRALSSYRAALRSCGPALMITAGDRDRTAAPAHAYKLARAQERCDPPPILRIDWGTGHGADKSRDQRIAEWTDELAFLFTALRMQGASR